MFFENLHRSGGGEITNAVFTSADKSTARITFKEPHGELSLVDFFTKQIVMFCLLIDNCYVQRRNEHTKESVIEKFKKNISGLQCTLS